MVLKSKKILAAVGAVAAVILVNVYLNRPTDPTAVTLVDQGLVVQTSDIKVGIERAVVDSDFEDKKSIKSVDSGGDLIVYQDDPVSLAFEKFDSSDKYARIEAMQLLVHISPPDAVSAIYSGLEKLNEDPSLEGVIAMGILSLANASEYLTDEDLENIYINYQNENINGRAARVLAFRGDESFLKEHVNKFDWQEALSEERAIENLKLLGSLESKSALPKVKQYLDVEDEDIQVEALLAFYLSADVNDLNTVIPYLYDASERVRQQAEAVVAAIEVRGESSPIALEMSVPISYGNE